MRETVPPQAVRREGGLRAECAPGRGRFAPSPTGPLHFGSLIAALCSYLQARTSGGEWQVRIEDIDSPRVVRGAAEDILRTLESYGMTWDGPVTYQSQRIEQYQAALEGLVDAGHAYPCHCSRREIALSAPASRTGLIYPGTCRNRVRQSGYSGAIRLRTDDRPISFHDRIQGPCSQQIETEVGDFVIRRADGLFAYQLAVVVDDAAQGITEVVRGTDLLGSTPRQIHLQRLLGLPVPRYAHVPVAVDRYGVKLSKQSRAPALDRRHPGPALAAALRFLNQPVPQDLAREHLDAIWAWAVQAWRAERIPVKQAITWAFHRPAPPQGAASAAGGRGPREDVQAG